MPIERIDSTFTRDLTSLCHGFQDDNLSTECCESIDPETLPEVYRTLLVHHGHMTTALESHYGAPVDLRVLRSEHREESYRRMILLTLRGTDRVVEFGVVRLNLAVISEQVREEILTHKAPLGDVLIRHDILRKVEPKWYLHVPGDCPWTRYLGSHEAYGRLGVIYCDDEPAIEMLEIVATVASDKGSGL